MIYTEKKPNLGSVQPVLITFIKFLFLVLNVSKACSAGKCQVAAKMVTYQVAVKLIKPVVYT